MTHLRNKPRREGFILLVVLIFIQVYSLLGITALENSFLTTKLMTEQNTHRLLLGAGKKLLHQVETELNGYIPVCIIPITPVDQLQSKPLTWWDAFACPGRFGLFRYYYVIEFLDKEVCGSNGKNITEIEYYRISLLTLKEHDDSMRVMLQSTIAKEGNSVESCLEQPHLVRLGRQAWREV